MSERTEALKEAAAIAHAHVMEAEVERRWHRKRKTMEWLRSVEAEAIEQEILALLERTK